MLITRHLMVLTLLLSLPVIASEAVKKPVVDADGTIHVPAFALPESSFLSDETRAALKFQRDNAEKEYQSMNCPAFEGADRENMPEIRQCQADFFYTTSIYKNMVKRYEVKITSELMGGVYTEIFIPTSGVKKSNADKVLINVHGGGFTGGSRSLSHLESIPIASVGQIKVVSIDYRMAPEYQFPAASEDVEKVYRELLKNYKPENIGLYGCSAGGILAAESMAWFLDKKLPLPAAVGMFCWGAGEKDDTATDSGIIGGALIGIDFEDFTSETSYLYGVHANNFLAYPGSSDKVLKQFPPSLLIGSTRDFGLSSIVKTHVDLRRLDVDADLFIWEGLSHAFHFNPELPESREAYDIIVKFFDKHLGHKVAQQ